MTKVTTGALETRSELTTGLLAQFGEGGASAKAELIPLIYKELHRLAAGHMRRERPNHTLQATALVNEACVSGSFSNRK